MITMTLFGVLRGAACGFFSWGDYLGEQVAVAHMLHPLRIRLRASDL